MDLLEELVRGHFGVARHFRMISPDVDSDILLEDTLALDYHDPARRSTVLGVKVAAGLGVPPVTWGRAANQHYESFYR